MGEEYGFFTGTVGEFQFIADAGWRGLSAFHVPGQKPYDVIVETRTGLMRVQVKASRLRRNGNNHRNVFNHQYSFRTEGNSTSREYDILACFCIEEARWAFFHVGDVAGNRSVSLRSTKGRRASVRKTSLRVGAIEHKAQGWEIFSAPIRPDKTQPLPEAA